MSVRLGLQVSEYRFGGGDPAEIFPTLASLAQRAEHAGFDAYFVMDHLIQVPDFGPVGGPVMESYMTLSALAMQTTAIKLGSLVTGLGYRQPTLLAKMVTTLDVLSRGRALLSLGAGWYEREHRSYGFGYLPTRERLERLAEGLAIVTGMLRDGRVTFDGRYYHADDARNDPRLRADVPVIVGGTGERLTFGAAARYADHLNIESPLSELPRKLAAVDARCAEAGRDRGTLEVSAYVYLFMAETSEEAGRRVREQFRRQGRDYDQLNVAERAELAERYLIGSADEVTARLEREVFSLGVDRLIVGIQDADRHPDAVDLAAATLLPFLSQNETTRRPPDPAPEEVKQEAVK